MGEGDELEVREGFLREFLFKLSLKNEEELGR